MTTLEVLFALIAASTTFGSTGYLLGRRVALNGQLSALVTKEGCAAYRAGDLDRYKALEKGLDEIKEDLREMRRVIEVRA